MSVAPILRADRESAIREAIESAGIEVRRTNGSNQVPGEIVSFAHVEPAYHADAAIEAVKTLGWDDTTVVDYSGMVTVVTKRG